MTTQMNELAATLADMEALLDEAPAQMRSALEEQIACARETLALFGSEMPAVREPVQWTGEQKRFLEARTSTELLGWLPAHMRSNPASA